MTGLIVHAGGQVVDRSEIATVPTPKGTHTWTPVSHGAVVEMVEQSLVTSGLEITDSTFALARDGARMFGVITLAGGTDYSTVIGVRNSHDQSFPVSFCLGSRVFVCDNLAFSAEVVVKTKHSRLVLDRLPRLVNEGVAQLIDKRGHQHKRIEAYKGEEVRGLPHLHDLVLRSYRAHAIPARAISEVLNEYDSPRHPEFAEPTLWSYFNCVTEVLKAYGDLPRRTQRLHGVIDAECGGKLLAV
jgi:hypothetical protein